MTQVKPVPLDPLEQIDRDGFALPAETVDQRVVRDLLAAIDRLDDDPTGKATIRRRGRGYAMRNLLDRLPEVRRLATSPRVASFANYVLGSSAFPVRGLLFDKVPEANWHVGWHQDLIIPVRERRDVPGFGPWSTKAGVPHVKPPAEVLARMLTIRVFSTIAIGRAAR